MYSLILFFITAQNINRDHESEESHPEFLPLCRVFSGTF